jgi:C-terminal processing protease CtpA/Prc
MPVQQYMQQFVRPYISQSASYITDDWCADYLLESFVDDSLFVEFIKPDKTKASKWLKAEVKQGITWDKSYSNNLFELHSLENGILKLDINSFNDNKIVDTFITALPLIEKAKAVIIDLRKNGGGNSGNSSAILSYFTDSAFIKGSAWSTREHRAANKAWGFFAKLNNKDSSDWANKNRLYYDGKVWFDGGRSSSINKAPLEKRFSKIPLVVLFGHQTASAAEDFLIMLDGLPGRATTIGEPSFASTGQPLTFFLPGGGSARICSKKDTYPDGRIFVSKGIQPDIHVAQTIADYISNKDVVLEKAIEVLKKKL